MLAETFKNQYVDHMIKTTYNFFFNDVCTTDKDNLSDCFSTHVMHCGKGIVHPTTY